MSKRKKSLKWADEYCRRYYGEPLARRDHMMRLAKYAPDIMISWLRFRSTTWKSPDEGGSLPIKLKELMAIAIETATKKSDVGHVEKALEAGATVEEIAEVMGICIMLAGFETYLIGGANALKRAEEYSKNCQK